MYDMCAEVEGELKGCGGREGKGREGGDGSTNDTVREGMCEGGAILGEAQALRRPTLPLCRKTNSYIHTHSERHCSKRKATEVKEPRTRNPMSRQPRYRA